ncbi:aminoacyltransferase [Candidatus Saccharibacteria bacterium]|nr:aminoacyltransferase [Candidatus Saccharibacteria bacterium]
MIDLKPAHSKEQWDDYVLEHDGHPFQLWGWGQVKAGHGWSTERLFAYDGDECIGAAQLLVRPLPFPLRAFAYIPRGPVCKKGDEADILDAVASRAKRMHKAVALSVEPDTADVSLGEKWVRATNKILSAETILLDLTKSEGDLLASMAKKTRQYIRKSQADVTIRQAKTTEDVHTCLDLYKQTASRAKFGLHGDQYYIDILQQLKDHSPIFIASVNDEPVAFLWLAISEDTAYELYGGVSAKGQELRANYALKWFAIRKTKEWGLSRYDFGGLIAGGVANFKQGWSEDSTTLAGTYDRPLSPLYVMWSKGLPLAKRTVRAVKRSK